ncbi:MAG: DUF945 family protein [Hahellaceae bacterium]|nr:DUF945 family protein [Hahellaceae bacterium]MCP5170489.1 DUF945 family protein [Hahellaceae bacterium]
MNKWMATGALGLLGVAVAGPMATGLFAEKKIEQLVATLNKQSQLEARLVSYDRGYLESAIEVDLIPLFPNASSETMRLNVHLSHGISSVQGEVKLNAPESMMDDRDFQQAFQGRPLIQAEIKGGLFTGIEVAATTPDISFQDEASVVSVSPLDFRLSLPVSLKAMDAVMVWQGMKIDLGDEKIHVGAVKLTQVAERITKHIWDGEATLSLSGLLLNADGTHFELDDMMMSSVTAQSGDDRIDSGWDLSVKRVNLEGREFVNQALNFAFKNIAMKEFDALLASVSLLDSVSDSEDPAVQAEQAEKRFQDVQLAGTALMKRGIVVETSLRSETPEGLMSGNASLIQPPQENADTSPLVTHTQGAFGLSVPARLIMWLPNGEQQIAALIEQNLMVQEGQMLKAEARLADSIITLNGQQIPVPPLF